MLILLLIVAVITYFALSFYFKIKSLPPGPTPIPILGNFHQIAKGVVRCGGLVPLLKEWQKEYGDVYTMWLGPIPTVNICDWDIANEAMVKNGAMFADKTVPFIFNIERNDRGVIISNGKLWQEQRRFALHALRNLGLGRNAMEERVMLEYNSRTDVLDKTIGNEEKSIDLYEFLEKTMGNVINRMLFSEAFGEEKEKRFYQLKKEMDDLIAKQSVFDMLMREWNCKFPPFKQRREELAEFVKRFVGLIREQINERKAAIASGDHILRDEGDDFVDAFLIEMQKRDHEDSFNDGSLEITILDLWAAGQDTTVIVSYWALTYLVLHPEVLKRVRSEIDEITGRNRPLSLSDKPKTVYYNAILQEVLRMASIVTVNFSKDALEDTKVGNYIIPKGTGVTAQLSLLLIDERHFEEPEKFKPERFLNSDAELYNVPFGMGKRACLGQALARTEFYLVLGNLILDYNLGLDVEHPASMESILGASMRRPQKFNVMISRRR